MSLTCDHPKEHFKNAFFRVTPSKLEQKVAECTNFGRNAVCYARCMPEYVQPRIDHVMTKITCICEGGHCFWEPVRDFDNCIGPCKKPQVTRKEVSKFFRVHTDYSKPVRYLSQTSNAFVAMIRAQAKISVTSWSQALVFTEPQTWSATSGEVNLGWNCNRRILMITPKPHATDLIGEKSYSFRVLIEDTTPDKIGKYLIHFFDAELDENGANCQDRMFIRSPENYCPNVTTPGPTITLPTQPPTKSTTTVQTTQTDPPPTTTAMPTIDPDPFTTEPFTTPEPDTCKRGDDLENKGELTVYAPVPDGGNCGLKWDFLHQHKAKTHFVALPNTWGSSTNNIRPYNDHWSCGRCIRLRCSCEQSNPHFKDQIKYFSIECKLHCVNQFIYKSEFDMNRSKGYV